MPNSTNFFCVQVSFTKYTHTLLSKSVMMDVLVLIAFIKYHCCNDRCIECNTFNQFPKKHSVNTDIKTWTTI